jgi:hypothetical protein
MVDSTFPDGSVTSLVLTRSVSAAVVSTGVQYLAALLCSKVRFMDLSIELMPLSVFALAYSMAFVALFSLDAIALTWAGQV